MTIKELHALKPGDFIYYHGFNKEYICVFCIASSSAEKITYHLIYNTNDRANGNLYVMHAFNVDKHNDFQVVKDQKEIDKYKKIITFS